MEIKILETVSFRYHLPPPQKYQRQKDQIIKDYMAQTCQPQKTKMWDSEPSAGKSSEKLVKSREMFQIF